MLYSTVAIFLRPEVHIRRADQSFSSSSSSSTVDLTLTPRREICYNHREPSPVQLAAMTTNSVRLISFAYFSYQLAHIFRLQPAPALAAAPLAYSPPPHIPANPRYLKNRTAPPSTYRNPIPTSLKSLYLTAPVMNIHSPLSPVKCVLTPSCLQISKNFSSTLDDEFIYALDIPNKYYSPQSSTLPLTSVSFAARLQHYFTS